ncbi:MAG: hypothetical protein H3C62_14235 [Gemmatimonadaceae bacterium]|nr:hypothetical protein [Gemmatimonadaceae bacterium]
MRAATPPRLQTIARYDAGTAVTTAARESSIRATIPTGHVDIALNNHGPGEVVIHDLTLKWWIDLVRSTETIVIGFNEPPLLLHYVPGHDFGGESVLHWKRAAENDEHNELQIDRSILMSQASSRRLPRLRLECPDPGGYYSVAHGEKAVLRIQVECRSLRAEYLWEFTFPVPEVQSY